MSRWARVALLIAVGVAALISCGRGPDLSSAVVVEAAPRIDPDYASTVIPPNIAPLNFRVLEEGGDCIVRISSDAAPPVEIHCPDRRCRMALKPWRELLDRNKGRHLYYDIFVRKAGGDVDAVRPVHEHRRRGADRPLDRLPPTRSEQHGHAHQGHSPAGFGKL